MPHGDHVSSLGGNWGVGHTTGAPLRGSTGGMQGGKEKQEADPSVNK